MLPRDLSESFLIVLVFEIVHSSSEKSMIKRDLMNNFRIIHKGKDRHNEKWGIRI